VLLAFDTATSRVTVALHDGERTVAEYVADEAAAQRTGRHGELLAPGIDDVLTRAGAIPQDITAVAVGVGPGPFTGLRVGLVTARTMALALEIPVYGVCTLDVLAAEAVDAGLEDFLVATDARRKEVYLASYDGGARVDGPAVLRPADAATERLVVGRGARLYPESFPNAAGPDLPSAAVLCDVVVAERYELLDPEPLYLRRPDAMEPRPPKRVT
jgi:tRNA threonylcarbamoyladenosine biosynthesis protein TsaB